LQLKHKIPAITTFKEAETVKTALQKIVQKNPVTKELTEWKAFQIRQNSVLPNHNSKGELHCT
jgi:hypothetical protein